MNIPTEALPRAELERRLLGAIAPYPCGETRFVAALEAGRISRPMIRGFALATVRSARLFAAALAALADSAPDAPARLTLLENLMEEEGVALSPSRGLVVRPERSHSALAMRFLRACGGGEADEAAIDRAPHATGTARALIAEGRWIEAASFLLVGQELNFAAASSVLFQALRRAGFNDRDLAFFSVHGEADARHGREALDLVLDRAVAPVLQREAIAAAGAGARAWFEGLGGARRPAVRVGRVPAPASLGAAALP